MEIEKLIVPLLTITLIMATLPMLTGMGGVQPPEQLQAQITDVTFSFV